MTHPDVTPVIKARGLMKRYGTVVAMNGCDFDLYPGEILGVIGDNGAGKSTLIKALSGAVVPDHGSIELEGREVHFRRPDDARSRGHRDGVPEPGDVARAVDCRQHVSGPRTGANPAFWGRCSA